MLGMAMATTLCLCLHFTSAASLQVGLPLEALAIRASRPAQGAPRARGVDELRSALQALVRRHATESNLSQSFAVSGVDPRSGEAFHVAVAAGPDDRRDASSVGCTLPVALVNRNARLLTDSIENQ